MALAPICRDTEHVCNMPVLNKILGWVADHQALMFLCAGSVIPLFLKQQNDDTFYNLCPHQNFAIINLCENLVCVQMRCQGCLALVSWAPGLQGCAMEIFFEANNHYVNTMILALMQLEQF